MKKFKLWLAAGLFASLVGGVAMSTAISTPVSAGTTCSSAGQLLTFPPWYRGLNVSTTNCDPDIAAVGGDLSTFIWVIVLNIIDITLNVVGYVAGGFIIYGGFLLMTSRGVPDNISKARLTIRDAAIGLVISFASVAAINLIVDNVIK